jgi:hypothetical protein
VWGSVGGPGGFWQPISLASGPAPEMELHVQVAFATSHNIFWMVPWKAVFSEIGSLSSVDAQAKTPVECRRIMLLESHRSSYDQAKPR